MNARYATDLLRTLQQVLQASQADLELVRAANAVLGLAPGSRPAAD
jgi:hypothetical protein